MPIATRRSCSPFESARAIKQRRIDETDGGLDESVDKVDTASLACSPQAGPSTSHIDEVDSIEEQMAIPAEFTRSYAHELDYRNKLVLAPMVRTGTCKRRIRPAHQGTES